jgi:hypothetical protein
LSRQKIAASRRCAIRCLSFESRFPASVDRSQRRRNRLEQVIEHLDWLDGVMVGRAAYRDPYGIHTGMINSFLGRQTHLPAAAASYRTWLTI